VKSDIRARSDLLKGFLYSLTGTLLLSTNFVTAKYGLEGFNTETFSLVWASAGAVYSLAIALIAGHGRQMALPTHAISKIALIGLVTGAQMIVSWAGLARLDPSFTAFLWRFQPVLTIALSALFLDERLMNREWLPIAIMISGGALSTMGRWEIVGTGVILTLLACCAGAMQMLIAKIVVIAIHPTVLVFYRVGIATLVIALWTLPTGKVNFDVQSSYWLVTLLGAFLGPCASYLLTFRSFRYWDLSRSSMILTAQPLFVLPLAYLFLDKLPTQKELLGGCMILAGVVWLTWIHFVRKPMR
jgi:drug/metabolite transporter (DMT)-like permease